MKKFRLVNTPRGYALQKRSVFRMYFPSFCGDKCKKVIQWEFLNKNFNAAVLKDNIKYFKKRKKAEKRFKKLNKGIVVINQK